MCGIHLGSRFSLYWAQVKVEGVREGRGKEEGQEGLEGFKNGRIGMDKEEERDPD